MALSMQQAFLRHQHNKMSMGTIPHTMDRDGHIVSTLDCRNLSFCPGPCNSNTSVLDQDSKAKRSLFWMTYPGHTTEVRLVNNYICGGCWRRWREFMDILEYAEERDVATDVQEIRDRFETDAKTIIQKFRKASPGAVHYLESCDEDLD